MITLSARGLPRQTLENVLRHKGLRYVVHDSPNFSLTYNEHVVYDPVIAVQYIERKFVFPQVLPDEPELYTLVLYHLGLLLNGKATLADYLPIFAVHGHPWAAIQFSALDLALEPLMQDPDYTARIHKMRNLDGYDI